MVALALVCSLSATAFAPATPSPTRASIAALSARAAPPLLLADDSKRVAAQLPVMVGGTAAAAAAALLLPTAANAATLAPALGDSAFVQAISLIFISELGDKTFFIAALLAARASKLLTFAGCAGALALMTAISVIIGQVFHAVPTSITRGLPLDDYVAIVSFLFFGVRSIIDALAVENDGEGIAEERADAEDTLSSVDVTGGWPLVVEACTLTIAAEIGDRSQLATIALGASQNPFGVFLGGTTGHCLATGMAVVSGSFLSKYLSEKVIGLVGGALFIFFAATTAAGVF